ncbi:MAG: hypothetical protein HRU09_06190 [Oligoflexales bacterium]|nr:hypothetical protein [Oligoflexales bacterium]
MPYTTYKFLHLLGILSVFLAWGALAIYRFSGENKLGPSKSTFRLIMLTHGIGMVLALVAGFGLLARLGIHGQWPMWVTIKLVLWLLLGVGVLLPKRFPHLLKAWWLGLIGLASLALYLVVFKPF